MLFANCIYTSLLESVNLVAIVCVKWSKHYYITRLKLMGGMRGETT
jgi:hypothetical protein